MIAMFFKSIIIQTLFPYFSMRLIWALGGWARIENRLEGTRGRRRPLLGRSCLLMIFKGLVTIGVASSDRSLQERDRRALSITLWGKELYLMLLILPMLPSHTRFTDCIVRLRCPDVEVNPWWWIR